MEQQYYFDLKSTRQGPFQKTSTKPSIEVVAELKAQYGNDLLIVYTERKSPGMIDRSYYYECKEEPPAY